MARWRLWRRATIERFGVLLVIAGLLLGVAMTAQRPATAGAPAAAPDFSIGADTDGVPGDDCNTSGGPTTCNVMLGSMFAVNGYLNNTGGYPYDGLEVNLQYAGIQFSFDFMHNPNVVWPGCGLIGSGEGPGYVFGSCALGIGGVSSTYAGVVTKTVFTCAADGSITMKQGPGYTEFVDDNGTDRWEAGPDETLTINCVAPAAYPTDTDGDGCPDTKEAGSNELFGGRRNFLNQWDYMNPSHDAKNRIDDILLALHQFFKDSGNPAYNVDTDRTYVGPNLWNLGPPNGKQRVDDILNIVHQFFHDCA